MENEDRIHSLLIRMAQAIYDKKGFNILALDVRGVSSMTDYFLIAEGRVDRHVRALCAAALDVIKEEGDLPYRLEGGEGGEWIVIDGYQVIIHLFGPDLRAKYQLEQVWKAGEVVDLPLVRSEADVG